MSSDDDDDDDDDKDKGGENIENKSSSCWGSVWSIKVNVAMTRTR